MFSCVWLHFKKNFGKYFLIFGCILENTIENTFSTCCSHFLTFSQLSNKHIMSFIPKNSNKTQKDSIFCRWDRDCDCAKRRLRSRSTLRARLRLQSRRFRWSRSTPIDAIAIARSINREIAINVIVINAISIVIDVDRRCSGDRRDRDRGASMWIVPFGSVCGSEQWSFERGSACVRERRKRFEVKIRTENDFSRFWLNFRSNWKYFQFDRIYHANQTPYFLENDFRISFSVKTNGALVSIFYLHRFYSLSWKTRLVFIPAVTSKMKNTHVTNGRI